MTVAQLIEKLKAFPSGAMVVVDGYEGGVETPKDPVSVTILENALEGYGYYGDHLIKDSVEYDVHFNKRAPEYPEKAAVLIGWRELRYAEEEA